MESQDDPTADFECAAEGRIGQQAAGNEATGAEGRRDDPNPARSGAGSEPLTDVSWLDALWLNRAIVALELFDEILKDDDAMGGWSSGLRSEMQMRCRRLLAPIEAEESDRG